MHSRVCPIKPCHLSRAAGPASVDSSSSRGTAPCLGRLLPRAEAEALKGSRRSQTNGRREKLEGGVSALFRFLTGHASIGRYNTTPSDSTRGMRAILISLRVNADSPFGRSTTVVLDCSHNDAARVPQTRALTSTTEQADRSQDQVAQVQPGHASPVSCLSSVVPPKPEECGYHVSVFAGMDMVSSCPCSHIPSALSLNGWKKKPLFA